MPVKRTIPYPEGTFFITFTCFQWLSLLEITNGYDLVYKWFDYLKAQGHYIIGYQIMPNHIHIIIGFYNSGKEINKIIGNGKRFMAYEIIKRLINSNHLDILKKLHQGVNISDRKRGKQYEVWEDSFDWKACDSLKMILQKLDYIHNNASTGKWQLVECQADYPHSSAKFYITNEQGIYPVTSYMEIEDVDLTKKSNVSTTNT